MQIFKTNQYVKSYKKLESKHKYRELEALSKVIPLLVNKSIGKQYKNHPLKGDYADHYELHLSGDCLLIYTYTTDGLLMEALLLENIGTHKELFSSSEVTKYPKLVQQIGDEFIKTMEEENFRSFHEMAQCYGYDASDIKDEIEYMINHEFGGSMYGSDIEDADGHEYKYRQIKSQVLKYIEETTDAYIGDEDEY